MDLSEKARHPALGGLAALAIQSVYLTAQLLAGGHPEPGMDVARLLGLTPLSEVALAFLVVLACPLTALVAGAAERRREEGSWALAWILMISAPLLALAIILLRPS